MYSEGEKQVIKRIIAVIDDILKKYGSFLSTRGANLYWAMQRLRSAKSYLQDELRIAESSR